MGLGHLVSQRVRGEGRRGPGFLVEHFCPIGLNLDQQLLDFGERGCQCRNTALGITQLGLASGQRGIVSALDGELANATLDSATAP
jgi:hypothetical protein